MLTFRQRILKGFYPVLMYLNRIRKKHLIRHRTNQNALSSIYIRSVILNDGTIFPLEKLKRKKILFVNTASDCGYTNQYAELEQLHEQYQHKLNIIAFPANDFKHQEKGSDKAIEQFCKGNFNIQFPIAKKSRVIKGENQNEVFQWLTLKELNGWNDEQPIWNFTKYLVNEEGILTDIYNPGVSPLSQEVVKAVEA